jgi:hypothetical protein
MITVKEQTHSGIIGERLPDFERILNGCSESWEEFDPTKYATAKDRAAIVQEFEPFQEVMKLHDPTAVPLLMEIAVMQDPRLQDQSMFGYQTLGPQRPAYFVTYVISPGDEGTARLEAWDRAIRTLRQSVEDEAGPAQMIVPHTDAYSNLYLFAEFGNGLERRPPAEDHPQSTPPAVWKNRYNLPQTSKGTKGAVKKSVDVLAHAFQDSYSQAASTNWHLLIVPFRRPALLGDKPEHLAAVSGEQGGCFFVVFSKSDAWGQPGKVAWLTSLSLKLNLLMSQAALRQAHTEIALRNYRRKLLATVTHFLPTECANVRSYLQEATHRLRSLPTADPPLKTTIQQAQFHSDRLDRLVRFSLYAWKVSIGKSLPTQILKKNVPAETFMNELHKHVGDSWAAIRRVLRPEDSTPLSAPTILANQQPLVERGSTWSGPFFVRYSEENLIACHEETLHNSALHGDPTNLSICILVNRTRHSGKEYVSLTMTNQTPQPVNAEAATADKPGIDEIGNIGMQCLRLAAGASSLPQPEKPVLHDRRYSITYYIGKVNDPPQGE